MKILYAILIFVPFQALSNNRCNKGEVANFLCDTGMETISVCASKKATQYRSGSLGKVEFAYPSSNIGSKEMLFYSEASASKYHEKHLRFESDGRVYVVFDRWNSDVYGKSTNTRGVFIYNQAAMPSSDDKAEFKAEYLVERKTCKRSAGIQMGRSWWANVENEDFVYGP